jgi:hypothetical protein
VQNEEFQQVHLSSFMPSFMSSISKSTPWRKQTQIPLTFPCIPSRQSFEATGELAVLSQQALKQITDFTLPFLHLPLISPHCLQHRFEVSEGRSVFVLNRKSYAGLRHSILDLDLSRFRGIYIRYIRVNNYCVNRIYIGI